MLNNNGGHLGLTILVVEDDLLFREMLCEVITILQPTWRVYAAVNGQDGVEKAQSKRPDLIFVDFQMPVMDGYQMALALKQNPETAQIPLILSTSEQWDHPRIMRMQALCKATLFKPFALRELAELLERMSLLLTPREYKPAISREMAIFEPA
ncbi:MAG: response regulator [Chloroflexi bacterium]|nr:response regulator [Chloroflexota bacterium]